MRHSETAIEVYRFSTGRRPDGADDQTPTFLLSVLNGARWTILEVQSVDQAIHEILRRRKASSEPMVNGIGQRIDCQ